MTLLRLGQPHRVHIVCHRSPNPLRVPWEHRGHHVNLQNQQHSAPAPAPIDALREPTSQVGKAQGVISARNPPREGGALPRLPGSSNRADPGLRFPAAQADPTWLFSRISRLSGAAEDYMALGSEPEHTLDPAKPLGGP